MLQVRRANQASPETQARRVCPVPSVQLVRKATPGHLGRQEYQEPEVSDPSAQPVRVGRQAIRDLLEFQAVQGHPVVRVNQVLLDHGEQSDRLGQSEQRVCQAHPGRTEHRALRANQDRR